MASSAAAEWTSSDSETRSKKQRSYDNTAVTDWFVCDGRDRIQEINRREGNPLLARGAFGEISIAIDTDTDDSKTSSGWHLVAVKTILQSVVPSGGTFGSWGGSTMSSSPSNNKQQLSREVFNELAALRLLNPHPCIVPLLAMYPSTNEVLPGALSLVFSYSPTDLRMVLERQRRLALPVLPFDVVKSIAKDTMLALQHCHGHGVLHRDVKPGNLLVSSQGRIQLCDFGLAKPCPDLIEEDGSIPQPNGEASGGSEAALCTLYYRPPEILLGGAANHSSVDIFSAGLVVTELILGMPLFCGKNELDQLGRLFDILGTPNEGHWREARGLPDYGKVMYEPTSPKHWTNVVPRTSECPFLQGWLSGLVALDPARRCSASEALQHAWFTSPPLPISSTELAHELIPEEFKVPKVLFSARDVNSTTLRVAKEKALTIATARRKDAQQGSSSKGDKGGAQQTLAGLIRESQLTPGLVAALRTRPQVT